MVRKDEIEPAAMNVKRFAEERAAHRRAFNVPAGPPLAPRAVPRRLAGLRGFPNGEIAGIAFLRGRFAPFALLLFRPPVRKFSIAGIFCDVEEHVAAGRVSM